MTERTERCGMRLASGVRTRRPRAWRAVAGAVICSFTTASAGPAPAALAARAAADPPVRVQWFTGAECSRRTVVLVPGPIGGRTSMTPLAAALRSAGFAVVLAELPATGDYARGRRVDLSLDAQAGRLAAALAALASAPAPGRAGTGCADGADSAARAPILVAHAQAASVALRVAARRPDRVAGLVSISGGPIDGQRTPGIVTALRLAPLLRTPPGRALARRRMAHDLRAQFADASRLPPDAEEAWLAPLFADLGAVMRDLRAMADAADSTALAPLLPTIMQPVVLVVGRVPTPGAVRPDEVRVLAERLPRFAVDSVAGSGTLVHVEAPAAVVQAVARVHRSASPRLAAEGGSLQPWSPDGGSSLVPRSSAARTAADADSSRASAN